MKAHGVQIGIIALVLALPAATALGLSVAGEPALSTGVVDVNVRADPRDASEPVAASGDDVPSASRSVSTSYSPPPPPPAHEDWMTPQHWQRQYDGSEDHEHDHEHSGDAADEEAVEPQGSGEEEMEEGPSLLGGPTGLAREAAEDALPQGPIAKLLDVLLDRIEETWTAVLGEDAREEDEPAALEPHSLGEEPTQDVQTVAPARDVALKGGAAVLTAAAAGAAGWALGLHTLIAGKLKKLIALAGFTRLTKSDLLSHGGRDKLYAYVRDRPGSALSELVDAHGGGRNTVTYHLRVLEREGLVTSRRQGRSRLYFAVGGTDAREHVAALAALRHDTTRAVAERVATAPGIDQQGLCQHLGLQPSLAHWHLTRLAGAGLVKKERDGRRVRYYPTDAWGEVTAITPP